MKSNEEFIEGIYSKKDAIIKKRKKKMSVIVTAVCAVSCVIAVAGYIGADEISADEKESPPEITTAPETVVNETAEGNADFEAEYFTDSECYTLIADSTNHSAKPTPEIVTVEDNSAQKGQAEEITRIEVEQGMSVITKPAAPNLPEAPETGGDGPDMFAQSGFFPNSNDGDGKSDFPIAMAPPIVTTENAVDAAYRQMTDSEKAKVSKDNAEAVVSRDADGTQTYTVYFELAKGGFYKVKLDSELERIS